MNEIFKGVALFFWSGKPVFMNRPFAPQNSKNTQWLGCPTTKECKLLNYLFKATPSVPFQPWLIGSRIIQANKDERRIKDASRKPRSPEVTTEQQDCKIVGFATNKPSASVHTGCDRRLYMLLGHQREYLACSSFLLLMKSWNIQIFVSHARRKTRHSNLPHLLTCSCTAGP